jgi:hypothetical protein
LAKQEIDGLVIQQTSAMDRISDLERNEKKYDLAVQEEVSKTKIIETKSKNFEKKLKETQDRLDTLKKEATEQALLLKSLQDLEVAGRKQLKKIEEAQAVRLLAVAGVVVVAMLAVMKVYGARLFC